MKIQSRTPACFQAVGFEAYAALVSATLSDNLVAYRYHIMDLIFGKHHSDVIFRASYTRRTEDL
jgi:hypothetical protein